MLPKTIEELNVIRDNCRSIVTRRSGLSAVASAIPIPGVDIGTDITLLIKMITTINRNFGLMPEQIDQLDPQTKKIIFVAITSIGSELIGKMVTKQLIKTVLKRIGVRITTKRFVRFIPFLGAALASSMSFGAMKMVGNSHVDDCYKVAKKAIMSDNKKLH